MKRRYRTDLATRILSKKRRDELRAQSLCINGAHHGPATNGVRCERCAQTHRKTA